jgi:hypothetical protein
LNALESLYGSSGSPKRAYLLADLWVMEASHHLAAIGTLYRGGDVIFGPLPLARTVLELSSRAVYLLAPSITPLQRLARATIEEAYSTQEMAKAEKRVNGKESQLSQTLRRRMGEIRGEVHDVFGEEADAGNPDQWELDGQHLIRPTEAVHQLGAIHDQGREFEGLYDRLSTHTHPSMGSVLFLDRDERGTVTGLTISSETLEQVAQLSLAVFHIALKHFIEYSGWHPPALDSMNDQIEMVFPDFFED